MLRSMAAVGVLVLGASNVWGLGQEHVGNEPLADANYTNWPNVMPVINDTHRVYHRWVNGNEHFFFKYDSDAMRKIAARLDDQVDWVKLSAAGALAQFTNAAEEVIEKLQAVRTDDKQLQERIKT